MSVKNSEKIKFRYPFLIRLFTIAATISAFLTPIYIIGNFVLQYSAKNVLVEQTILLATLYKALAYCVALVFFANAYPEITVDKNGLYVHFLWYRLPLTWQDIIEVKPYFFSLPNRPSWVVRTRKLTPFHRLYGLLYSFTFLPSFFIFSTIENYEELTKIINKRRIK
jgi:hypothetical protein